jgi:hypothetical protein
MAETVHISTGGFAGMYIHNFQLGIKVFWEWILNGLKADNAGSL